MGANSGTGAMADTFTAYQQQLEEFRERLNYVHGAVGVASAVGSKVVAVDLFDKPSTCARVWNRLLSGVVLDALEAETTHAPPAEPADVERVLGGLQGVVWQATACPGEGAEYRAESPTGDCASVLVFDDTLIHGSVLCAQH